MHLTILRMVVTGSFPAFSGQLAASAGLANQRGLTGATGLPGMPPVPVPSPNAQRVTPPANAPRGSTLDFAA